MKIIESEAGHYWCPHGLATVPMGAGSTSSNRTSADQPLSMCIGRKCMAWRWNSLLPHTGDDTPFVLGRDCGARLEEADKKYQPRKGWCGLSGSPR